MSRSWFENDHDGDVTFGDDRSWNELQLVLRKQQLAISPKASRTNTRTCSNITFSELKFVPPDEELRRPELPPQAFSGFFLGLIVLLSIVREKRRASMPWREFRIRESWACFNRITDKYG